MIEIYTDGACSVNPGKGGYGIILSTTHKGKPYTKELSQGFEMTTNNRMELLAVIVALEALKRVGEEVIITSDSKYVIDAVQQEWLNSWLQKDFKSRKNKDLWLRYLKVAALHNITFKWIKGHSSHKQNERCDKLAVQAYKQKDLQKDGDPETEDPTGNIGQTGEGAK